MIAQSDIIENKWYFLVNFIIPEKNVWAFQK